MYLNEIFSRLILSNREKYEFPFEWLKLKFGGARERCVANVYVNLRQTNCNRYTILYRFMFTFAYMFGCVCVCMSLPVFD